ncbi:response regulator [Paracoccus ravus]|uniref:response regulator n=1 Tax=Paracoccus ravus TaxID=2447760 RepID=UPI00106E433E|nr:response regulator [Paracoccus ravus]
MTDRTLNQCRILVVEDEYLLAAELCHELAEASAVILGPVGSLAGAIDLIHAEERIDGAVLDINLRGEMVFPAADLLTQRDVPMLFTTGYDPSIIPPRFAHVVCCGKPADLDLITSIMGRLIHD